MNWIWDVGFRGHRDLHWTVAPACYFIGLNAHFRDNGSHWSSMVWFGLAVMFHELVCLSLGPILIGQCVLARGRLSSSVRHLLVPVAGFAGMVLLALLSIDLPVFMPKQELQVFRDDGDLFARVGFMAVVTFGKILDALIPFRNMYVNDVNWWRALGGGGVLVLGALAYVRKPGVSRSVLIATILPLFVIIFGILGGRVATRGFFANYYYVLMMYFTMPFASLLYARVLQSKKWLVMGLSVIMTASNVAFVQAFEPAPEEVAKVRGQIDLNKEILRSLSGNDACFAGLILQQPDPETHQLLDISMANYACNGKSGLKPLYFAARALDYGLVGRFRLDRRFEQPLVLRQVQPPVTLRELDEFWPSTGFNFPQAQARASLDPNLYVTHVSGAVQWGDGLVLELKCQDEARVFYNTGLRLLRPDGSPIHVVLVNNSVYVIADGRTYKSSFTDLPTQFQLRLQRFDRSFMIFMNDQLVTQVPIEWPTRGELAVYTFNNATPAERIEGARMIPPGQRPLFVPEP